MDFLFISSNSQNTFAAPKGKEKGGKGSTLQLHVRVLSLHLGHLGPHFKLDSKRRAETKGKTWESRKCRTNKCVGLFQVLVPPFQGRGEGLRTRGKWIPKGTQNFILVSPKKYVLGSTTSLEVITGYTK